MPQKIGNLGAHYQRANGEHTKNLEFEVVESIHLTTRAKTIPIANFANLDPFLIKFGIESKNEA